jgi:2-hydroxychromene-2-carboxylate isomerase
VSLKTAIVSRLAAYVTSEARLNRNRAMQEKKRTEAGKGHTVEYFHDTSDPYSHLAVQVLPAFVQRYDISLKVHLAGPTPDWAAPERERLEAYARQDAARLAARAGLSFRDPGRQPDMALLNAANAALSAAIDSGGFLEQAAAIGEALWAGTLRRSSEDVQSRLASGSARRQELGHYLGATLHYGGEWYWGVDRLHYLEARLAGRGARKPGTPESPLFAPPGVPSGRGNAKGAEIHWYLSFRSPYTYISAQRARALSEAYGAELKLRFVLPMVMRGLPVPRMKGRYITLDTAREARRLGIPFGKIADPVGRPVERGYSLLPWARTQGRGFEYCHAFLAAVWSQGVDAGSDEGMRRIVEMAGLDWSSARPHLDTVAWRAEAEANRAEMMALGVWGVPSFRVGNMITWGQDRLWLIEGELRKQAG